jgi:hypothetical protein
MVGGRGEAKKHNFLEFNVAVEPANLKWYLPEARKVMAPMKV